jgi:PAS domain S-box-containing protein
MPPAAPPEQILLAIDHDNARSELTRILTAEGFAVAAECSANRLFDRLLHSRPDLLILGFEFNGSNGLETLCRIRADSRLPELGVALFGEATKISPEDRACSLDAGTDAYLAWPTAPILVAAAVRAWLRRRQAIYRLHQSEVRFNELAEHIGEIFFNYDPAENRLRFVNSAFEHIFGLPSETVLRNPLAYLDRVHPDDRALAEQAFQRQLAGEETHADFRIIRPDGEIRWIHEHAVPVSDPDGRTQRIVGTMTDRTTAKLAEEALRRSEERYALAALASEAGLWDWDLATGQLIYSPAYREMLGGFTPEEFPNTPESYFSILHPDDAPRVQRAIEGHLAARSPVPSHEEFRLRTKSGEYRWFRSSAQAVWDAQGRPIRMVGSTVDIHDERIALAKVREQAALLDQTRDAILVRTLDHRITYWNRGAERLYGWSGNEAIGRNIEQLLYRDPTDFRAATQQALENGDWSGELDQLTKDGCTLAVEARWTLLRDEKGQPSSILAINSDITQRRSLEKQFLRAQRLESIGTLAGGIAHDLNNVLTPIMMSIELLRSSVTDEPGREVLDTIATSARRGAALISQVLSFARGVEGRQELVQLEPIVADLSRIVAETFPRNVRLETALAPDLWTVPADATQIHQVLLNLCLNARDALPGGGRIALRATNARLDEHYAAMNLEARPGPYVVIEVEDNGTGMPREILDRIFDPFFTTKEVGQGTGLGLATTLAITKAHGGFIRVRSEVGAGTTFELFFPAAPGAAPQEPILHDSGLSVGRGQTVLVVDDEESIRRLAQKTLSHFGYRVLTAANGAEALALFASHRPEIAVVITDLMMPVMDGPATISALRQIDARLPIIVSTGLADQLHLAAATAAGVRHFLAKPYTAESLLRLLDDALHPRPQV